MSSRALTSIPDHVSAASAQAGSVPRARTDTGYFWDRDPRLRGKLGAALRKLSSGTRP